MTLLYLLLCLVLIVIAALAYQKLTFVQEGFTVIENTMTELASCPPGLIAERKGGYTYCKDGAKMVCAIVGGDESSDGVPACHIIFNQYLEEMARVFCPPSMSKFFQNLATGTSGCTSGLLTPDRSAPIDSAAPQCSIYSTDDNVTDQDITTMNSCFNINQMESAKVFGTSPVKSLIPLSAPDSNGQRAYVTQITYNRPGTSFASTCFPDRHSTYIIDYIKRNTDSSQLRPEDKARQLQAVVKAEEAIKAGNWMLSCEAQKRVFIDHTMQESELASNY